MARSKFKFLVFDYKFFVTYLFKLKFEVLRMKRNVSIHSSIIGKKCNIHSGKKFFSIIITKNMVGHKFGEFRKTRYLTKHVSKDPGWKKRKK